MRTSNPTSVREDFVRALADIDTAFTSVDLSRVPDKSKQLVAEYCLVAAAVLWEGYVSDLFVAYISHDMSQFASYVLPRIAMTSDDDIGRRATSHVEPRFKRHLITAEVRAILDETGNNITLASTDRVKMQAGKLLVPADAAHFTEISAAQTALIEAWRSARNFLAHRSKGAKDAMQASLRATGLPARLKLGAGTRDIYEVGPYLVAVPEGGAVNRIRLYISAMRALGISLCP
jgi:hypothetical protein